MNTGNVVPPGALPPGSYSVGSYPVPFEESVWTRRGTWGSIVVGALVGFAITIIMATFGAATGLTAGAVAADKADDASYRREGPTPRESAATTTREDKKDIAKGSAAGGALWFVLTALVAGLVGGGVAGRIAQVYSADVPILGLSTWAIGMVIMVALAAFGASGMLGGLGAGAGEAADKVGPVDADAAKTAATAATIAVWGFFLAQLIGLGATMVGAKAGMKRRLKLYPRTATP